MILDELGEANPVKAEEKIKKGKGRAGQRNVINGLKMGSKLSAGGVSVGWKMEGKGEAETDRIDGG